MRLISQFLNLAMLLSLGSLVWMLSGLFKSVPFEQRFDTAQVECLAAIMRIDAFEEMPELRALAQVYIADAVMRYRVENSPIEFCEILRNALTIYPKSFTKKITHFGRGTTFIKDNPKLRSSPWIETLNRARQALGKGPLPDRCATHYIRPNPKYTFWTNETQAQKEIVSRMKPDKDVPGLLTKFYCPK